jgi:uncharacterized protein YacL
MKFKKILISGIIGGTIDFLLGWLLYGLLFRDQFPGEMPNMLFIFLGCMTFGFLVAYILNMNTAVTKLSLGIVAGAEIGFFLSLWSNFFMRSNSLNVDYKNMILDIVLSIFMGAIVGASVAFINDKLIEK